MRLFYLAVLFSLFVFRASSQIILNAYAKITAVSGNSVLTLSNVNQANHSFVAGEKVVVMQMQDDVIGTNTTNVNTFGDIAGISNAGNYEIAVISATAATSMTLTAALTRTYNTGTNSSAQVISFRNLGNNYTTTNTITALAWDGNVGGVLAIETNSTLTLNHRVVADGLGFLGGASSASADEACDNSVYITNSNLKAFKGEGIYKNTNTNFTNGRGKIASGGGGGSQNNSGGGGGSNYTSGGNGGLGWQCNTGNSGYGLGGVTLSSYISKDRIFMGGGGGGGQQNNNLGTAGGTGGGIILIKTNTLVTNTTCSNTIRISANGNTAANSGNDGAGGGGAAGTIIVQASTFSINATCPLTITASGGNGGSVTNSGSHGGGAGGGQGVVIYAIAQPTLNVATQVNNGTGGANDSGGGSYASGGGGSNGAGIISGAYGVLPVELISFNALIESDKVKLTWVTSSEKNNAFFTVERSNNGFYFNALATVKGNGTSLVKQTYKAYDLQPFSGINYYRLKQTDTDGGERYVDITTAHIEETGEFNVFPNPVEENGMVTLSLDRGSLENILELQLCDLGGKQLVSLNSMLVDKQKISIDLNAFGIKKGIYLLKIKSAYASEVKKLVVK